MAINTTGTQNELLEAAGRLFYRYGYRKTTIDDIAREAGIGKGTVYLHFESKEQLGEAWMERKQVALFDEISTLTALATGSKQRIRTFLTERVMARHRLFERSQLAEDCFSELKDLVRNSRDRSLKREQDFLADLLHQGIDDGVVNDCDAQIAARSLIFATNGLLPLSFLPKATPDSVEGILGPLVDLLIHSISNE